MDIKDVKKIAVIGMGTMGPGIAQVMAHAGYEVAGYD
ncbi:MAG: 3-hydroxyacyl-CoA dehydrogenase family protein, partial [Proteobacteria bacterium]|nr:3-hydroxyacyl-CoA dehydrogenase family protein [Pseudomonadota bacterium]